MKEVFKKTRLLLMPSSYESWGRVGLEAAASGIPTIATATEGLLESLGRSGTFLHQRDLSSLVEAVRSLDNNNLYKEKSEAARSRAIEVANMFNSQMDVVERQIIALSKR
jgi:glycosyltransferase involved in cell wall biosynthesis